MKMQLLLLSIMGVALGPLVAGCGEPGEEGTIGVDCGDYGTEHDGHCHCDPGYLFDGDTCVNPEEITVPCDAGEHDHMACLCPAAGDCACEEGDLLAYGGNDYCTPVLHDE